MAESGITAGKVVLYGFLGAGVFVGGACLACAMLVGKAANDSGVGAQATAQAVANISPPRPTYEEQRAADAKREAARVASGLAAARRNAPVFAATMAADYEKNELAADQRYKDGWWKVEGVVDRVAKDIGNAPYITLRGPRRSLRGVQCYLQGASAQAAARTKPGDRVTVVGQVDGLMMNVGLKHCEFL